jgi:hypothetical protein
MSSYNKYKKLYWNGLSKVIPSTAFMGFITGFIHNIHIRKSNTLWINRFWGNDRLDNRIIKKNDKTSMIVFVNLVGYTSMGICMGIVYPISFPLCMIYTIYSNFLDKYTKKYHKR